MRRAYRSPGTELQQHSVLMFSTQINLRPMVTALHSWTYLVAQTDSPKKTCVWLSYSAHGGDISPVQNTAVYLR